MCGVTKKGWMQSWGLITLSLIAIMDCKCVAWWHVIVGMKKYDMKNILNEELDVYESGVKGVLRKDGKSKSG